MNFTHKHKLITNTSDLEIKVDLSMEIKSNVNYVCHAALPLGLWEKNTRADWAMGVVGGDKKFNTARFSKYQMPMRYGWDGGSQKNSGSFGRQETVNLRSTFLEEGMCAEVIPKAEDITHPTDRASQLQATMSGGKTLMAGVYCQLIPKREYWSQIGSVNVLNVGDVQIKTQDNSEGNRSLKAVGFIVSRFYRNLTICDLEEGERRTYQDQLGSVIYHSSGYIC
ncbi:hypothetical protein PPACK8108_LOCUS20448 [Phakopsora pachyrhizi]|uniref:Uncharacterized protein n=1 Tax=Phakopsora pachyrhizi TaxID=170000 RepID=A0AAV0BHS5_PHAPC|nr:hypothetical protein PPACK8108_LOCUS20448 [Phakopsora pachyrhizi]